MNHGPKNISIGITHIIPLLQTNHMPLYAVNVMIENKSGISDPEGDTILQDLVMKGNYPNVKKISTAKMLKFKVTENTKELAEKKIRTLCDEFRIYNPMVSQITVQVSEN